MENDYYRVLGVLSHASADEIRRAYRRQAKLLHPDKHFSEGNSTLLAFCTKMAEASVAYEVLSDPKRRSDYDSRRESQKIPRTDDDSANIDRSDCPLCIASSPIIIKLQFSTGLLIFGRKIFLMVKLCPNCGTSVTPVDDGQPIRFGWWGITGRQVLTVA